MPGARRLTCRDVADHIESISLLMTCAIFGTTQSLFPLGDALSNSRLCVQIPPAQPLTDSVPQPV